ncbi:HesA/MoeB/ThiF family protein [Microbacterium sp. PRF11]|jgi:adenylyltransferase/sulfurtransferase|uniref:HesA/MoeB/ThiF family protein n=1 Tax=Microbacterium sp. PRF11 TaxID=2962593 RepID=UPI002881D2A6|nr:HesA/MoeB/ThiF family protein [Microbacterium sp. PRF11]MDT0117364.1 HesA/MoeB/ThiF family protein [Microbacterium sp. PRF11]
MRPLVEPVASLAPEELIRTARHAVLAGIGEEGQRRLAAARIAVVGAGGLGSPVLLSLAAAGVGELIVIDDDVVERTNLQRQLLHRVDDIGTAKTASAARAVRDLSPLTVVHERTLRLTSDNARELFAEADLVIDGSDTFDTREAVAAATEVLGIPLVWGAVQEWAAQVTVFWSDPPEGHAPVVLGDLFPPGSAGEPPTCAQVGVLGSLCVQVGGLLSTEAIKLVTGAGDPLLGRLVVVDALRARQDVIPLSPAARAAAPSRADAAPLSDPAVAP